MRVHTIGIVFFLVCHIFTPSVGRAEEPSQSEEDARKEESRQHSNQAQIHYNLGRFEQALLEYSRAYELFTHPAFLFNIGQCHREIGNYDRAIFFFEGYLREKPDAGNRDLVEELLGECHTALENEEQNQQNRELPPIVDEQNVEEQETHVTAATNSETIKENKPIYRKWWFWTVIGVAVAGVTATGLAVGLTSSGDEPSTELPAGSLGYVDWR